MAANSGMTPAGPPPSNAPIQVQRLN
jgi:hypothetical protein